MLQNHQGSPINKLRSKLTEMFRLDQKDLDFGVYRIMNQRRNEISAFLDEDLLPQVHLELSGQQDDRKKQIEEELKEHVERLRNDGIDPEDSTRTKELRKKISDFTDYEGVADDIFNHLFNFFNRYYEKGDFISKRRYKDGTYLLPYSGEEIKLLWANSDQYYVKTTPTLKNYSFKTSNGRRVTFEVRSGCTELNSNKGSNGSKRLLMLKESPAEIRGNELFLLFNYSTSYEKNATQKSVNAQIVESLKNLEAYSENALGDPHPSDNGRNQTVLEKHLEMFTGKHEFDYFIHQDLGEFLKSELDNYIRTEILDLDSFEDDSGMRVREVNSIIRVVRRIALKIIKFLAQFEDFQKSMWLKRKFVLKTDYCVTLDHIIGSKVETELLTEILANEVQLKEWERNYSVKVDGRKKWN